MTIAQQMRDLNQRVEITQKSREYGNLARLIMMGGGDPYRLNSIAKTQGPRIKSIIESKAYERRQKAAVGPGTMTGVEFAAPLTELDTLEAAFLATLRAYGAFDFMLDSMRRVPFRTRIGVSTVPITATIVSENAPKPVSRLTLSGGSLTERKAAAILVLTDELLKFGSDTAGNLFVDELASAVAVATDTEFISILTAGAPSMTSTGGTAEAVRHDLRSLLTLITTDARSRLFLLVPGAVAKNLSVLHTNTGDAAFPTMGVNGGSISGINVVVSDGVPANTALLVDAQQVAAASETMALAASNETMVNMDTNPGGAGDSPPSASAVMTSLWQMNMTGLKFERWFGATKITTTGVAVLNGIAYVGDSPGP